MFNSIIKNAAAEANKLDVTFEGCSFDSEGLPICNKCGERRQTLATMAIIGRPVRCMCRCEQEIENRQKAESKRIQRIEYLVSRGITKRKYRQMTFEDADPTINAEVMQNAALYCLRFEEMKCDKIGVLLFGGCGGGKTYIGCCISNRLIDNGIAVLVTTLNKLVNDRVTSMKNGTPPLDLGGFEVVMLDDVGTENASKTAFEIVDELYTMQKIVIATSNLTPKELRACDDLQRQRLFDRIIEMTGLFWKVDCGSRRLQIAKQKSERIAAVFGNEKKEW